MSGQIQINSLMILTGVGQKPPLTKYELPQKFFICVR